MCRAELISLWEISSLSVPWFKIGHAIVELCHAVKISFATDFSACAQYGLYFLHLWVWQILLIATESIWGRSCLMGAQLEHFHYTAKSNVNIGPPSSSNIILSIGMLAKSVHEI